MAEQVTINLVNGAGEVRPFFQKDAENAVKQGWRLANDANVTAAKGAQGVVPALKAGAEGFARGLTFGLSDVAETKLGVKPEDIAARQAASPWLGGVGRVVGAAGPLALGTAATGGIGLGPLAGTLTAGAATGALEGGGTELSAQLLENKGLRGEEIAAEALKGGLFGLGFSALGEGAGAAVRAVGRGARGLQGLLTEGADAVRPVAANAERAAVTSVASKRQLLKLEAEGRTEELGARALKDVEAAGGQSAALKKNAEALQETGSKMGAMLDASEEKVSAVPELAETIQKLGSRGEFETKVPTWKKQLNRMADDLVSRDELSVRELHGVRKELDSIIGQQSKTKAMPRELMEARSEVNAALGEAMGPEWQALNKEYGTLQELKKLYETGSVKELKAGVQPKSGMSVDGLKDAVKGSPAFALATGHPLAAAGMLATKGVAGYLEQHPDAIANGLDRAAASSFLARAAALSDSQLDHSVGRLLGGAAPTAAAPGDYARLTAQVQAAADNPAMMAGHVTRATGADMHAEHPEIADAASATAQNAVAYLNQVMPKPQTTALLGNPQPPTADQRQQWLAAYQAITKPQSVFANPTKAGMGALQAVYPEMYARARQKLLEALRTKKPTYQQQLRVARILGDNTTATDNPQFVQFMQQTLAEAGQSADQGQKASARNMGAQRQAARALNFGKTVESEQTQLTRNMGH